jgi:hypothetical protein
MYASVTTIHEIDISAIRIVQSQSCHAQCLLNGREGTNAYAGDSQPAKAYPTKRAKGLYTQISYVLVM